MEYKFVQFTDRTKGPKVFDGISVEKSKITITKVADPRFGIESGSSKVELFYDRDADAIGILKSENGSIKMARIPTTRQLMIYTTIGRELKLSGRYYYKETRENGMIIFQKHV